MRTKVLALKAGWKEESMQQMLFTTEDLICHICTRLEGDLMLEHQDNGQSSLEVKHKLHP